MQLNNDCIREVMLYLEKNLIVKFDTTNRNCFVFEGIPWAKIINDLNTYKKEDIVYTLYNLTQAGFIESQCSGNIVTNKVTNITYNGHIYLKNINSSM